MKFSKEKFKKNAAKNIIRQLGNHIDALDGMEVDFNSDSVFGDGIAEYEHEGEEYYLYPVKKEWCTEDFSHTGDLSLGCENKIER